MQFLGCVLSNSFFPHSPHPEKLILLVPWALNFKLGSVDSGYNLRGCKFEEGGEFTRVFEPVWIPSACV